MANERRLMDEFKSELMSKFIDLCRGNDYNKLTLLRIGETIDRIYEKYSALSSAYAVEVVRCKDCKHWHHSGYCRKIGMEHDRLGSDFCSYGRRKDNEGKAN